MLASLALIFIQGLLPLALLYLIKKIVDEVSSGLNSPDPAASFNRIMIFIGLAAGVALLEALARSLSNLVQEGQALRLTDHVQSKIHDQSINVDLSYYEDASYHDSLHRAQKSGAYRPTLIVQGLLNTIQNSVSLLAMIGLLFVFHWSLSILLLIAVIPGTIVKIRYADELFSWEQKSTKTQRLAAAFDWILTSIGYAKEIRLFGLGHLFRDRHKEYRDKLRNERLNIAKVMVKRDLFAQTGSVLLVFGSFALIVYRTVVGMITLGDMVMFYQAFQRSLTYLRGLLGSLSSLYEHNLFLANLEKFLSLERKIPEPEKPALVPVPLKEGVSFKNVNFAYPNSTKTVLDNVEFKIGKGEVVALVGKNGSGKTTLVKMLCRFYQPDDGEVLIDGLDLKSFDQVEWRRQLSVIFQDYAQYPFSAYENIWFGNIDLPRGDGAVEDKARLTGAHEILSALPGGYDSILGKQFENGSELSTGEWQKVALARAFVRDAQLVVLDEPTSAMDARAEYEVFKGFKEILNGRSALIISHRFSTVRMADRILVMDNGKITENGTHEELLNKNGTYANLYKIQAEWYK